MVAGDFLSILLLGGNGWLARYKFVKMCLFLSLCTVHHINYSHRASDQGWRERELSQGRACPVSLRTVLTTRTHPKTQRVAAYLLPQCSRGGDRHILGDSVAQKANLLVEF